MKFLPTTPFLAYYLAASSILPSAVVVNGQTCTADDVYTLTATVQISGPGIPDPTAPDFVENPDQMFMITNSIQFGTNQLCGPEQMGEIAHVLSLQTGVNDAATGCPFFHLGEWPGHGMLEPPAWSTQQDVWCLPVSNEQNANYFAHLYNLKWDLGLVLKCREEGATGSAFKDMRVVLTGEDAEPAPQDPFLAVGLTAQLGAIVGHAKFEMFEGAGCLPDNKRDDLSFQVDIAGSDAPYTYDMEARFQGVDTGVPSACGGAFSYRFVGFLDQEGAIENTDFSGATECRLLDV